MYGIRISSPAVGCRRLNPRTLSVPGGVLEPEVAKAAALNASPTDKTRLQEIIDVFRAEAEAETFSNETDKAFHMCIARASGNQMYVVMYDTIWKAMEQKMWELILRQTIDSEKHRRNNFEEHSHIAQAILSGDADEAFSSMKTHMENLEIRFWD